MNSLKCIWNNHSQCPLPFDLLKWLSINQNLSNIKIDVHMDWIIYLTSFGRLNGPDILTRVFGENSLWTRVPITLMIWGSNYLNDLEFQLSKWFGIPITLMSWGSNNLIDLGFQLPKWVWIPITLMILGSNYFNDFGFQLPNDLGFQLP